MHGIGLYDLDEDQGLPEQLEDVVYFFHHHRRLMSLEMIQMECQFWGYLTLRKVRFYVYIITRV